MSCHEEVTKSKVQFDKERFSDSHKCKHKYYLAKIIGQKQRVNIL